MRFGGNRLKHWTVGQSLDLGQTTCTKMGGVATPEKEGERRSKEVIQ